jgi:hypothetical protein
MKKSFKWIAEHQVSSFLILTFVFSWFFFLLSFFVFANSRLVQAISGKIAVFGPALIAMLVSAIAYPKPKVNRIKVRWSIFVAVWLFSWAVFLAYLSLVLQIPLRTTVIIGFGVCALLPAWCPGAILNPFESPWIMWLVCLGAHQLSGRSAHRGFYSKVAGRGCHFPGFVSW